MINVLRYIQQNPVKAKLTDWAKDYPWSSYNQYLLEYKGQGSFIDTELIKGYFIRQEDFENYMNVETKDEFLESKPVKKILILLLRVLLKKR